MLWWPKRGQWKYAFIVRRNATGLRFHRELHAMLGIWTFVVFMAVSYSGVVLAWPQTMAPRRSNRRVWKIRAPCVPTVEPVEGAQRIGADRAVVALALAKPRGCHACALSPLPARRDQPISVALLNHGAINASVTDRSPITAKVLSVRDPSQSFLAWQRPVHQGTYWARCGKFLVFLSGFLPAAFCVHRRRDVGEEAQRRIFRDQRR